MILASGARGREFDSRNTPNPSHFLSFPIAGQMVIPVEDDLHLLHLLCPFASWVQVQIYEKVAAACKLEGDVFIVDLGADNYKDLAEKCARWQFFWRPY
ncbi:hypothetical protein VNO77_13696 [Canavalia gladiata]|uniref:Uncharacterized protein n=1 Tax=Canavalia gladiata TaxID=3824 RepID=A0AAN9QV36_CANGL